MRRRAGLRQEFIDAYDHFHVAMQKQLNGEDVLPSDVVYGPTWREYVAWILFFPIGMWMRRNRWRRAEKDAARWGVHGDWSACLDFAYYEKPPRAHMEDAR